MQEMRMKIAHARKEAKEAESQRLARLEAELIEKERIR